MESKEKGSEPRNVLCFFFFGLLTMVYDEITLVAAQDVLAGSSIATTTVVLSIAFSVLSMKLTIPWIMQSISYLVKIIIIVAVLVTGLLTLVCSSQIPVRLAGVSVIEAGVSTSEITLMSMTAFYDPITVSAFVAGIGMSSLFGPFYYTALTTWLDLSPRTTMTSTVPWPLLFLVLYAVLNKEPIRRASRREVSIVSRNDNKSASVDDNNKEKGTEIPQETSDEPEKETRASQMDTGKSNEIVNKNFNVQDKLKVALKIFPFIFFLLVTYFAEYLSNHAVITTLAFPDSSLSPRDHYPYYMLAYHVGKFIGRSHIFLISCFNPGLLGYILVRKTWVLAVIAVGHLVVFLLMSWYRIVSHIEVVIGLCVTEGFTAGSMYVNSVHTVSETMKETNQKEFALGLLTVGDATGKLLAGITGLWQEPFLRRHCLQELELEEYCFTRHVEESGWSE